MKLAYVLGEFPSLSETFILREMLELRRRGFEMKVFALADSRTRVVTPRRARRSRRTITEGIGILRVLPALRGERFRCGCFGEGHRQTPSDVVHDEAEPLSAEVCYRPAILSVESLAAMWHFGFRHPVRLARAIGRTVAANAGHPVALLRCLRNLSTAAVFAREALRFGAAHIHAHFASMPADVARMMGALMACDFSISAHAADIHLQPAPLLARKVRAARFVAVCTHYGAGEIRRRVSEGVGNLHVVPHGVPPIESAPSASREPLIIAVGRLQPKKGFVTLVEACRLLRERGTACRCVIAGEGPERPRLEQAIARAKLGGVVQLTGALSQDQVAALLREARVFALPCTTAPNGDRDGLPNAILEALAAGVPVVATPVGGIPEAIEDGRTGLLAPPDDAGALAARLEELLKNDGLCRTLSLSGRALATERFDLERNVARLAELFEQSKRSKQ